MPHSREYLHRAQELEKASHRKETVMAAGADLREADTLARIHIGKSLSDLVEGLDRLIIAVGQASR